MEFDLAFKELLLLNKESPDLRILRLEHPIPTAYETRMNDFLEKFFVDDPFDIRPQDLDVVVMGNAKIKRLKFDRRPSTFLSTFRFLELYRQQLNSIRSDLNDLGSCYKNLLVKDLKNPAVSRLKDQIMANILSAGRILKKWAPHSAYLYRFTISNVNLILAESVVANGPGKGFVNLRKIQSESYLNLTLNPYYGDLVNFCIICIAYTSKLKVIAIDHQARANLL